MLSQCRQSRSSHAAGLVLSVVLFASYGSATPSIWSVHIDEAPAPPPSKGPPFSANASRNPALLKYQIPGVVGGYVGVVLILGFFLLTICKRRRRQAQSSRATLAMEMVKPLKKTLDPSPVSPSATSMRSWKSWVRRGRSPKAAEFSPYTKSIVSFDETVIEADKAKRQEEMERLYAAVMSQGAKSPKDVDVDEREVAEDQNGHRRTPSNSSRNFSRRQPPPPLDPVAAQQAQAQAQEPTTPRSPIKAIYPPWETQAASMHVGPDTIYAGHPRAHAAEQRSLPASPRSQRSQPSLPASPRSIVSQQGRPPSAGSSRSKTGRSIRNLPISAPIQNYQDPDEPDARGALSPRGYPPGTPGSPPFDRPETPIDDEYGADDADEDERDRIVRSYSEDRARDDQRHPPRPAPQRNVSYESQLSRSSSAGALPLRTQYAPQLPQSPNYYHQQQVQQGLRSPYQAQAPPPLPPPAAAAQPGALPLRHQQQPLSPRNYTSPTPTKTTFLSPRRDVFYGGLHSAQNAPRTGMATPYSPYMPFTPVTPVTPHLTTRAERRQRQKDEGRRVPTAIDEVLDEKDLFGSAW